MAVPTDLTLDLIVTEALYKAGYTTAASADVTRAGSYFMREVLNDIWTTRDKYDNPVKFKMLQTTYLVLTTIGISKYALPASFDDEISVSFLTGTHTGTAQAGAAGTITLEDEEDAAVVDVEGHYILTTGGTGATQLRQCTDYDDPDDETYVANISPNWTTNPSSDTTYRVIDRVIDLTEDSTIGLGALGTTFTVGIPSSYAIITEDEYAYLLLDKPPSASTYGLFVRHYADPNELDLTGSVMTRIYNNWYNALVYGVAAKIAEDEDDNKYQAFLARYETEKQDIVAKESPSAGEFEGFVL